MRISKLRYETIFFLATVLLIQQDMINGRHVLPGERLVSDELLMVLERHEGTAKYINDFAGNLKRNLRKAIIKVRYSVIPLIPNDIVEVLRIQLSDQSFALCFEPHANFEEALNLRQLQITNERNPA